MNYMNFPGIKTTTDKDVYLKTDVQQIINGLECIMEAWIKSENCVLNSPSTSSKTQFHFLTRRHLSTLIPLIFIGQIKG